MKINSEDNNKDHYYTIIVKGNMIARTCMHYVQGLTLFGLKKEDIKEEEHYDFDGATLTWKGDLILDEQTRALPYASYLVEGMASFESPGNICIYSTYDAAYNYYKANMKILKDNCSANIDKKIKSQLYKGLLMDVFSILELFLSDLILCLIYTNIDCFNNALNYFLKKKECQSKKNSARTIEQKMHDFFFKGIVYHRFNDVGKMYKEIANIEFPRHNRLQQYLFKRNNIAHRYSLSNQDGMRMIIVNHDDITDLINVSDKFANELIQNTKILYSQD